MWTLSPLIHAATGRFHLGSNGCFNFGRAKKCPDAGLNLKLSALTPTMSFGSAKRAALQEARPITTNKAVPTSQHFTASLCSLQENALKKRPQARTPSFADPVVKTGGGNGDRRLWKHHASKHYSCPLQHRSTRRTRNPILIPPYPELRHFPLCCNDLNRKTLSPNISIAERWEFIHREALRHSHRSFIFLFRTYL